MTEKNKELVTTTSVRTTHLNRRLPVYAAGLLPIEQRSSVSHVILRASDVYVGLSLTDSLTPIQAKNIDLFLPSSSLSRLRHLDVIDKASVRILPGGSLSFFSLFAFLPTAFHMSVPATASVSIDVTYLLRLTR